MINVVVGTEPNQFIAQKVLEFSIRKHARKPVNIRFETWQGKRVGGTNFGYVRFMVPQICGYQGKAIYMDADQLVFRDLNELAEQLDDAHSIALVNQPVGYFGGKPVAQHNQTSVMVLNCEKLKSWTPEIFSNVVPNDKPLAPGQIHYKDFMSLKWFGSDEIKPIDPMWNHFNEVSEKTKLVHFSYVRAQPWKRPRHPLTKVWSQWLKRAIGEGAVTRMELFREVMRGHVHPYFLRFVVS